MHTSIPLAALLLLIGCSQPSETQESEPAVAPQAGGIPEFSSIDEAIRFATDVDQLRAYTGVVWGSEHFQVPLPDGGEIDNWTVDCLYREVFAPYGEEAYADLAPLLDHEHTFVQVGAYAVLNSAMNRHGLRRTMGQTREERVAAMRAFQQTLPGQ